MDGAGSAGRFESKRSGGLSQQKREGMLLAELGGFGVGRHEEQKEKDSRLKG
jgi:hypothetical protein